MNSPDLQATRLRELDALRGVGALAVLLFHYTTRFPQMFPGASHVPLRIDGGHYSVLLFFALSGFAISFSFRKIDSAGDFMASRFARLFPAYWAAMAVTLLVQAVAQVPLFAVAPLDAWVNPTMLQSFAHLESIDGAYWTLGVELTFYICMGAIWRFGLLGRIEQVLVLWLGCKWLLFLWDGMPEPAVLLMVLRYIHFFAIGLVSYRVYSGLRTWGQQLPILALLFATIATVETPDVLIVAAVLQIAFVLLTTGHLRWLCVRPILWLGAMSYPLYLVHQHVGMTIMLKAGETGLSPWIGFALATIAALAIGQGIHRFIERPAGNWMLAKWARRATQEHESRLAIEGGGGNLPRRPRLRELDALRGLGAVLVVNFHYSTRFQEMFPNAPHVPFTIFGGNYRVLLFFAISGFAIYFTMNSLKSASDFVVNRVARLFPAYWAAMAITLTFEHFGHIPALDIPQFARTVNLTMLQAYFYLPAVDGAYWTLAVEIGFYASMLTLWWFTRLRHIEPVILGWLGLKWLMFYWTAMPSRVALLLVLQWIPWFAIGILSYRLWSGQRTWREQVPYFLAVIGTVAFTDTPDLILAAVVLIIAFALLIEGRLGWICLRPLTWVGGISYSLYLIHQNVGYVILLNGNRMGLDPLLSYGAALLIAFGLATLVNRFVEAPVGSWLLRHWKQRRFSQPLTGAI